MTSRSHMLRRQRSGFTLIEVSLAVLVLGLGLMAAFGLFPAGVRQNEDSTADTRAALFADYVLNGMQANAAAITNWNDWKAEPNDFPRILGKSGTMPCPNSSLADIRLTLPTETNGVAIIWPSGGDRKLRYQLTVMPNPPNNRVFMATLEVRDLDDGSLFDPASGVFYTEFVFKGM